MKAPTTILITFALASNLCLGQDAEPSGDAPQIAEVEVAAEEPDKEAGSENSELISSEEFLKSLGQAPASEFSQSLASNTDFSTIDLDTKAAIEEAATNDLTTIQLQRVQISGTVTPVVKKRTFRSFLQLFNPFAPEEYGGAGGSAGQGHSRAFLDPIESGPSTPVIRVDAKPKEKE